MDHEGFFLGSSASRGWALLSFVAPKLWGLLLVEQSPLQPTVLLRCQSSPRQRKPPGSKAHGGSPSSQLGQ